MVLIKEYDLYSFAMEVIPLTQAIDNPELLEHLHEIVVLVMGWSGGGDPIIDLDQYVGERLDIARGSKDDGWLEEFETTIQKAVSEFQDRHRAEY